MRPHRLRNHGWFDLEHVLAVSDIKWISNGSPLYCDKQMWGCYEFQITLAFKDEPFCIRSPNEYMFVKEPHELDDYEWPEEKPQPPIPEDFLVMYRQFLSRWSDGEIWEELP